MSENLTIDEILRQAEEIRKKTARKAEAAIDKIHATQTPLEPQPKEPTVTAAPGVDDKTRVTAPVTDKTQVRPAVDDKTRVGTPVIPAAPLATAKTTAVPPVGDKTRPVRLTEKTGVVPNLGSKRSFFGTTGSERVYSKEPPEIIEKPATIKSRSKFDKTSDLQEIPTILAVEELEHTRILGQNPPTPRQEEPETEAVEESAQIRLEGFDDQIENVPNIDENVAERILEERRRDKVNKFRLFAPEEGQAQEGPRRIVKSDFRNADERTAILERLFAQKTAVQTGIVFTVLSGGLLLLVTLLRDTAYLPSFLASNTAYFIAVLVLYGVVLAANIPNLIQGFSFKNGVRYDLPIAVAAILVAAHTVLLYLNPDLLVDGGAILPSAVTLSLFLSGMGRRALLIRLIENFEFITDGQEKYTVETIRNVVDATIISRGLLQGDPVLKSSVRTDFPTDYLEIGCSKDPADRIAATTGCIMLGLSGALLVAVSLLTKNWGMGVNAGACALCISLPAVSLLASNTTVQGVSRALAKRKAMVNGFAGAGTVNDAGALVMEANDLFGPKSCSLHGVKLFNGAKIDDVILQTAAVIIKTKSPLAYVFDDAIVGKQSILPEVDGVLYEDKMGTSAWIYKKKILVGNRDLLINHDIAVPKQAYEEKYTRKGRKALYLAVAGKIMAMFIVSYSGNTKMEHALKKLEKSGMTILLHSCDPYINEDSVAELFHLPAGYVRVMNSSSGRVFEKYSDLHVEKSPADAVHDGSALGFISVMRGAETLEDMQTVLAVLISFGCVIGFAVVALLAVIGGYSQLTTLNILIFQGVWSLFVLLITRLKRLDI